MEAEPGLRTMEGVVHRTRTAPQDFGMLGVFYARFPPREASIERKGRPSTKNMHPHFSTTGSSSPRNERCEVEVGGDYYYIGPQRAGLPPNLKLKSGVIARGVGTEVWSLVTHSHWPSINGL